MVTRTGERHLILHMGARKTGSSALQIDLVRNRHRLARQGIMYPSASNDDIVNAGGIDSGNGLSLARWLQPQLDTDGASASQLDDLSSLLAVRDSSVVLFSSEFLYDFEELRLQRLKERIESLGVRLTCVVYLRNISGFALALYSQAVKRELFTGTFDDFVGDGALGPETLSPVTSLHEVLGPDQLRLFHYDSLSSDVTEHFLGSVLGVRDMASFLTAGPNVNRSLSAFELALMRRANRQLVGKTAARRLSDALLGGSPIGQPRKVLTPNNLAALTDSFADVVARINKMGLENGQLAVNSSEVEVARELEPVVLTRRERRMADVLVALANQGS